MRFGLLRAITGLLAKRRWKVPPRIVDRDARTLEHWRHQFAGDATTIECSRMRLIGKDHEGDIFTGPGRIVIDEKGINFFLHGSAADSPAAFKKYLAAKASPYDALEQFRLI